MNYYITPKTSPEEWENIQKNLRQKREPKLKKFDYQTDGKDYLPEITDPVRFQKALREEE